MFRKGVTAAIVCLLLNATVFSPAYGSIFSMFATSGDSSANSSGQSSGEASGQGISSTMVVIIVAGIAAVGLIAWGISSTTEGQQKPDSQAEVSLLIDEAAHFGGHNMDLLSKIYNLDIKTVSGIVMKGYLDKQVSAVSPESAEISMNYLNKALLEKSVEVNGSEPAIFTSLKYNPEKLQSLLSALAQKKTPSEIYSILFAF